MLKFIKTKKGLATLAALVVVGAAAFGAYAYFTNTGTTGPTTPVAVGTVALNGTFTVAEGTTAYAGGTALLPTDQASLNAVVATVPFTVTNTSEANELLTSYTITLSGTQTIGAHPACAGNDPQWWVNGAPYTGPVTVSDFIGADALPLTLKAASDTPTNAKTGSFTIQLVDNNADQDSCMGFTPTVTVDATS